MRNDKKNIVVELSIQFSLGIISFSEILRNQRHFDLASQVFRIGTSIGANIHEAQNAESLVNFTHKFKIAAKEANEVNYWLELCERSKHLPSSDLKQELKNLIQLISKIISTSKKKLFAIKSGDNNSVKEEFSNYQIDTFSN
jgi:four helix bundle protein